MPTFDEMTTPQEVKLLVAFFDLTHFFSYCQNHTDQEVFRLLADYFEFAGELIESSGGKIIKFIGDAGLVIYPEEKVNEGVVALLDLKNNGDKWLANQSVPSRNIIQAHFGPVMCGPLGTRSDKRFDIIGQTINIAAKLKSNGLAMTPQVFRQLDTSTRKLFKKHTPPVTYIPFSETHHD